MPLVTARHLRDVRKMARVKTPRRRKVPRQIIPRMIEHEYAEAIATVTVRAARASLAPLLEELPRLLDQAARSRLDTIEHRLDAGEGRRARQLIEQAKARISASPLTDRVEELARKFADRTSTYQRAQLGRQVRAALGVDVLVRDRGLAAKLENFAAENAALIRSLQTKVHDEVEKLVTRAIVEGRRHEDLAVDIENRFGVTENHAKLIARDQIGKVYSQLNQSRQQDLGIKRWTWRSMEDERVRAEHVELNGQVFPYDDPPSEGVAGTPIMCRCYPDPVFDDILEA